MSGTTRALSCVALTVLLATGCGASDSPVTVQSSSLGAANAESVHVGLVMQPGNLRIDGGAHRLLEARFIYQPSAWKPTIRYQVRGNRGDLVIRQPRLRSVTSHQNTWNVKLSDGMPITLDVTSGPGNATLRLRTLTLDALTMAAGPGNVPIDAGSPSLKTLKVSAGPGNLTVNLIAPWKHNIRATIDGGIGNTTLRLPSTTGVRVVVRGEGLVTAPGFAEQQGAYVNPAFGRSPVAVLMSLDSGIGNVVLTTGA